jgi:hypothetical protein
VKLTTYLRLVPGIRMSGAVPPLPMRFHGVALIIKQRIFLNRVEPS